MSSRDRKDEKQNALGRILLKQKLVNPTELEALLVEQQRNPGQRLASTAEARGIQATELLKALSEQHGVPGIDLEQIVVPLLNLKLIPNEIAQRHLIFPVLVKDDRIFLAMADPGDRRVTDEVEFVTGRRVFSYVALHDRLRRVIQAAYALEGEAGDYYIGEHVTDEYLRQLGIQRTGTTGLGAKGSSSIVPAEPRPFAGGAVVVEPAMRDSSGSLSLEEVQDEGDDELGIAELSTPKKPAGNEVALDPAFRSLAPGQTGKKRERPTVPKILVVDDEADIRRLLRRVLAEKGFDVLEASRGIDALRLVRDESPHVILLDAMLPEVHGFEICRRIKSSKRYGHIPVIMVSAIYRGWRFAEDLKASYGVETFLEKPFKINDVLAAVERALEGGDGSEGGTDEELSRDAGECLAKGIDAYQKGDIDHAIEHLKAGIQIDGLSFRLHYHLGLLYGRRDDVFDAIRELETAVDLAPRHFSALKNLAVLFQKAGFKHKATEMWERALASAPDEETKRGIKEHLMSLL